MIDQLLGILAALLGPTEPPASGTHTFPAGFCRVTDGDTVRCGDERVRMVELDAPEMRRCRRGRVCVPGDPRASKAALERAMQGRRVTVVRYGRDHYRRTLADVRVGSQSMTCRQILMGHAQPQLKWGDYGVIAEDCPGVLRRR